MKKQFTLPTSLVFFSYTRTLSTFISKLYPSLLLFMFTILFSQVSFAQTTITSATVNDDLAVPGYFFSASHIETSVCECTSSGSGHAIAFVTDGTGSVYASFTPEYKAGLTVTDDNGHFDFYEFGNAAYSAGSPTTFRNPDVVLLEDGKKAIITFETNDITYGAYVLELEISISTSYPYVTINLPTTGLRDPLNTTPAFASSPRIDADYAQDRFAIVSIQGNMPVYSIFKPFMGSYAIYNAVSSIYNQPAATAPVSYTAMLPDIALGHVAGSYEPECVISYIDGDPGGSNPADLFVNYQDYSLSTFNQFHTTLAPGITPSSTTLFTSLDMYPNYPHICSEEEFNGTGAMQWALAESLVDPAIATGSGLFPMHMLYVHSDYYYQSNNSALLYLDTSNTTTNTYMQGKGTLDWMIGDAFVAWRHEIASPNTQQIVGFMNPLTNNPPFTISSSWDQVYYNYNVATVTGTDWLQALSVASDATIDLYVVAEIYIGKIIYKVRNRNNTGFKPNNVTINNNTIYPNPCNDILNIYADSQEVVTIKDIYGSTILKTTLHKGSNTVNTSHLGTGIYFLLRKGNSPNSLFTVSH